MELPEITPELILNAYCQGIFPMADPDTGEISWYSPDPRGIFPLDAYKPKRSLRNILNRGLFEVRINSDFEAVMRGCAENRETWISEDIIDWYCRIHLLGYAHSVETWYEGRLAGGLYGVSIGGAFFGESMFSRQSNASKVALHYLITRLRAKGFILLDTQFITGHLEWMGAVEIPRKEYLKLLSKAIHLDADFIT